MERNIKCFIASVGDRFDLTNINQYGIKENGKALYADLIDNKLVIEKDNNTFTYDFKLLDKDNKEIINLQNEGVESYDYYVDLKEIVDGDDIFTKIIEKGVYGFTTTDSILDCVFGMHHELKDKWNMDIHVFVTKDCEIDHPFVIVMINLNEPLNGKPHLEFITHDKNEGNTRHDYFDGEYHYLDEENAIQYFLKL